MDMKEGWWSRLFGGSGKKAHSSEESTPAPSLRDMQTTELTSTKTKLPEPRKVTTPQRAEDEVAAEWKPGDVILDLYEVTGVLGEGGMGKVYKVHHKGWKVDLAVKSPKPAVLAKAGGAENFVRECETWVNLGLHPHTVSCYYVRTLGGVPRVFAEYVEGGSLSDWIRSRTLYEGNSEQALARILDIAIQFAWGLHYAHEQGLIHQDVKPANVMMTPDSIAKVTDFGLAKARGRSAEHSDGVSGQSILAASGGMTPAYCSPEQARGEPLSRKTDIWSWGLSVLEMFTGEVTWMAGQVAPEALQGYSDTGTGDATLPRMPEAIAELLKRCFAKEPKDRPQTMQEVARSLQEVYQNLSNESYSRREPKAAELSADSLNNRALSYLDLEKNDQAEAAWEDALAGDPQHPETTYNRGLVLWRQARLTDEALVGQLEEVRSTHGDSWRAKHLLALVHLERGDVDAALPLLETAAREAPNEREVQEALKLARSEAIVPGRCLRNFEGHTGSVNSVCLSADARLALSGSRDNTLRLWEVATGRCVRTFEGHMRGVDDVCLSGDARLALSGSGNPGLVGGDGTLRLWEVATGRCLRTFEAHTNEVHPISLSTNARFALWGSKDNTLRLLEIATGRCLQTLEGHTDEVSSVCLSADARLALSGSLDNTLRLWEVATGRCLRVFEGHSSFVMSVCLSADARLALSGSKDNTLRLWEIASGQCLQTFKGHTHAVHSVCLSADARVALSAGRDKTLRLWEVATGRCLCTFNESTPPAALGGNESLQRGWLGTTYRNEDSSACLSADARFALSGGEDKTLRWWQLPKGIRVALQLSRPWSYGNAFEVNAKAQKLVNWAEAAIEDGRFAAALNHLCEARTLPGRERTPQVLDVWGRLSLYCRRAGLRGAWMARSFGELRDKVTSVCLSGDARLALSGSIDNTLQLWDVITGRCLQTLEGHTDEVNSVCLDGVARLALSGSTDNTLRLWEVTARRCLRVFKGHTNSVMSVSLSADARLALSGSKDNTLRLWEVATGRCLRTLSGHTSSVVSVCLSADARFALSGSWDGTFRLWDIATGQCLRMFRGIMGIGDSVCLSADARLALSGGTALALWEIATGQRVRIFKEHAEPVASVCMSADARLALSGSGNRHWKSANYALQLWDVTTGRCIRSFEEQTDNVSSVWLSADARFALSGSWDETLRLWYLDWELETCDPADWDEGARPYLETLLNCHTPYAGTLAQNREPTEEEIQQALTRRGEPSWTEEDLKSLLHTLGCAGYGWLRPQGVRAELERLARDWKGPPPLPGAP